MSPSVARARPLQGATSTLSDLTLHDGRELSLKLGSILPTPKLKRTMDGASSITIPVLDPERKLLRDILLRQKWDATIDGLPFRYLGTSKSGDQLTIRLIDRRVARMREFFGPKRVLREPHGKDGKGTTRAEFIKSLFEEALPRLQFYCPELHVKQPIASKAQGKKAKGEADANRGKGIGATSGLTVKGVKADAEQTDIIERDLRVAEHDNAPLRARIALVIALIAESLARNVHGGDSSSVGTLQLLDIHGSVASRLDVERVGNLFLTEGFTGSGGAIKLANANPDWSPAEIATAVQGNRDGAGTYAPYQAEGREWVEAFEGGDISGVEGGQTVEEPYRFEVKEENDDGQPEDYWEAAERLADEVNWRLFLLPDRAVLMDEIELIKGQVRLEIDDDTEGIEDVDFDFNSNKTIIEATVTAFAAQWSPPPASVATLADYGPASLGPGDPPGTIRRDSKGQKFGVSSAVKASTHEGKGRFLVSSIETPLTEDSEARKATIKMRRPTPPLPEPAAETKTVGATGGSLLETTDASGMGELTGTPEEIVNQVIDYAHANGFPGVTRESVRAANAAHSELTSSGNVSDHKGPPTIAWAADISNGETTPEETHLAAAIAKAFGIPWDGSGLITHVAEGYQLQLIYKAPEHYDHVHFGCHVL